jgi:hypothetical protein
VYNRPVEQAQMILFKCVERGAAVETIDGSGIA